MLDLKVLSAEVAIPLHLEDPVEAANAALKGLGQKTVVETPHDAYVVLNGLLQALLDNDLYAEAARLLWKPTQFTAEPESVRRIFDELFSEHQVFVQGAASMGKCQGPDVPILMYDGSTKRADEIVVGDVLMGDDSTPRNVLSLVRGRGQMYRIISPQGSWTCNGAHQLVLECALSITNGDGKTVSSGYTEGKKVEVEVEKYLQWSTQRKRYHKQYRVGVEMPEQELPIDPYIFGLWVGDGNSDQAALTKLPGVALDRWVGYFKGLGYQIREAPKKLSKASTWFATVPRGQPNAARDILKSTLRNGEKAIPSRFLRNSRAVRLQLFAGLIDSDGYVHQNGYTYVTKFAGLKDDVVWLARSLGFRAKASLLTKGIKSTGFSGQYWTIYISGPTHEVPALERKSLGSTRAAHREPFEVESIGEGDYYGFTVDGNHRYLLGDFVVTHNSFSIGVWLYLDWRRDPANTNVQIVGPSEKHLETNIFSHLVSLHNNSSIPGPGTVTTLCIALNPHDKYAGIKGVVIPVGKKSAGRLQGTKVKSRPDGPHPKLGNMTRLRIFLEEAENIHVGVWDDVVNLSVNPKKYYKAIAAYNPKDRASQVGVRAEPLGGWGSVDIDSSLEWRSKRGWRVLRLDALRSENVILGTDLYQGLQNREGLESATLQAGGVNTAGYYSMCRGWYPEEGLDTVVFPPGLLKDEAVRGEYIFAEEPENVAALDCALEGGDNAILVLGRFGRASGVKLPGDLQNPDGITQIFKDATGKRYHKSVLQVDQFIAMPKGRTEDLVENSIKMLRTAGVRPEWLAVDRTGNGAGVHDMLRSKLGDQVKGINSSTSSTEMRILVEDMKLPCDEYNLLCTELWFALKKWVEVGCCKFGPALPGDPLIGELGGRRFIEPTGNPRKRVEPKAAYKSRGNKSPDRADAVTLLLHCVRMNTHLTQSFKAAGLAGASDWRPMKQRLDVTNIPETLE